MDIDFTSIYGNMNLGSAFTGGLIKLLVGILLFGVIFYSFMFILKYRVLQDTIDITSSNISKILIGANLAITIVGSILAFILILL